jgi:hypothetical protein
MADWRDYILQHFREPIHRLTLVADPDGLMLEMKDGRLVESDEG